MSLPLQEPLARIGVLRALHLGDLLCAVPALRALRAAQPQARISLIGLPWAREFVARYAHSLDELVEYPCGESLEPDRCPGFPAFLAAVRAQRFDLVLQLHGDGSRSNALVARFGAARCAGYHPAAEATPDALHLPWRAREPEVLRWLRLLLHLGAPHRGVALELPLEARDRHAAFGLLRNAGIAPPYVCLHAGARLRSRRWPAPRFGAVARRLLAEGWSVVLTGTASEAAVAAEVLQHAGGAQPRLADLCARTPLGTLAALIEGAAGVVCNDTGVSHLAAALATPSVVISSGSDARRWAPLDARRHRVFAHSLPCRPCLHEVCPTGHGCALAVGADEVATALGDLLAEHRRAA